VDGRVLVPLPTPAVNPAAMPAAAPPTPYAAPGQYAQPDVYANTGAYAPTGQYPQTGQYAPARAVPPLVAASGGAKRYSFVVPGTTTLPSIIGAVLVLVAAFLAWVDVGGGADTLNAFDVPLSFLWDKEALADDGIALGAVLLVLAAASFLLRHFRGLEQISRVPGALVVVAVGLYLLQMNSLVSDIGGDLSLFDVIGIGVWPALIGGGLLIWGGTAPRRA
jgi:hypothetical protein